MSSAEIIEEGDCENAIYDVTEEEEAAQALFMQQIADQAIVSPLKQEGLPNEKPYVSMRIRDLTPSPSQRKALKSAILVESDPAFALSSETVPIKE